MVSLAKKVLYVVAWVAWLVFCYFLSQVMIFTVLEFLPVELSDGDTVALTVISALVYVITLVILVGGPWLIRKRLKLPEKAIELVGLGRKIQWSDALKAVSTYVLYLVVLIATMSLFAFFFPELSGEEQNLGFVKSGNDLWQLVLIFFSLVIVPPVFEEAIMRGFLFSRLRIKLPYWPTTIIVSAVFAISHGQINVALDTFVLSLFLCNLREKTGAIWAAMIVHILKNLLGFLLVFVFML